VQRTPIKKTVPTNKELSSKRGALQTDFFAKNSKSYGGTLLKTRQGRRHARPISTTQSMHLVLRSSQAIGEKSFTRPSHAREIKKIIDRFALKYGVRIHSLANVGTHLHFQIRFSKRQGYYRFIRAITAAIAMLITGRNRWTVKKNDLPKKFWDYRPFSRILTGLRDFLSVKDYIQINQLEGLGVSRPQARWLVHKKHPLVC
jgi:putative transposase